MTHSFGLDDVDAYYTLLLKRGVGFEAPPFYPEKFWAYSAFFRGLENYRFELQTFNNPNLATNTTVTEVT